MATIKLPNSGGYVSFTGATGSSSGSGGGAVTSVNGKIGAVVLTAQDVGALPADASIPDLENVATKEYVDAAISAIDPDFEGAADFATKEYVDEAIKDVAFEGTLDDYYTKAEVNAKIQAELEDLESSGGLGGLDDYYTKTETVDRIYAAIDETILYNPEFDFSNYATHDDVAQKITEAQLEGAEVDMSMYYNKSDTELLIEQSLEHFADAALKDLYYDKDEVDAKIPDVSSFVTQQKLTESLKPYGSLVDSPNTLPVKDTNGYMTRRWTVYKNPWRDVPVGGFAPLPPELISSDYKPQDSLGTLPLGAIAGLLGLEWANTENSASGYTMKELLSKGIPVMYTTSTATDEGDNWITPARFNWAHLPDWYQDTSTHTLNEHWIHILNDNTMTSWSSLAYAGGRGFNIYPGDVVWVLSPTVMVYIRKGITNWNTLVRLLNRLWYANNKSGLEATDVQGAIDELAAKISDLTFELPEGILTEAQIDAKILEVADSMSSMAQGAERNAKAYTDDVTEGLASESYVKNYVEASLEGVGAIQGEKGEKGDPFTYEDFTPEQLAALKGEKGDPGPKGADGTMTFEDLTEEQRESLKGAKGDKGDTGAAFTYDMFTEEQLAALKGEKGEDGTITFEELTEEQKASLKGEPGVYIGTNPTEDATVWINPEGDSSGNFATEGYVDNAIAALDLSAFQTAEQVQAAITAALSAIGVAEEGTY